MSYAYDSIGLVLTINGVSANELYAAAESSNPSNPIGAFTLGYIGASGFVPFVDHTGAFPNWNTDAQGYARPMSVGGFPLVKINPLSSPILLVGGMLFLAPHEMWLHPSQENYPAVVRFTAPATGSYTFSSSFRRLHMNGGNGVVASVTKRSVSIPGSLVLTADGSPLGGIYAGGTSALMVRSDRTAAKWGGLATVPALDASPSGVNYFPNGTAQLEPLRYIVDGAVGDACTYVVVNLPNSADVGEVYAWGSDSSVGALGNPSVTTSTIHPIKVWAKNPTTGAQEPLKNVIKVAAGKDFGLALKADGSVWSWGANDQGQLGAGDTSFTSRNFADRVYFTDSTDSAKVPLSNARLIAAGERHALVGRLALSGTWSAYAWGANESFQLGIATTAQPSQHVAKKVLFSPAPTTTDAATLTYCSLSAGAKHSALLSAKVDANSTTPTLYLQTWGDGSQGQLGGGVTTTKTNPSFPGTNVGSYFVATKPTIASPMVACGANHTVVLNPQGEVTSMGANAFGQLGNGATTNQSSSAAVMLNATSPLTNIVHIAAGKEFTLALQSDPATPSSAGTVLAWGRNELAQLAKPSNLSPTLFADVSPSVRAANLPVISVAKVADANENGTSPVPGIFRLTRSGSTAQMNVYYRMSGTASNGLDYDELSGVVSFPLGSTTVDLPLLPRLDYSAEGQETAMLCLNAGSDYLLTAANTAVVTIEDALVAPSVWLPEATLTVTQAAILGGDLSGITWSPTSQSYFGIQNRGESKVTDPFGNSSVAPAIYEFSADGTVLRTIRTSSILGSDFEDPESICWISGSTFIIAEERKRQLVEVDLGMAEWLPRVPKRTSKTISLTPAQVTSSVSSQSFSADLAASNNDGLEGVCYNPTPASGGPCYYGVLEGQIPGHMHVFRISLTGICDELFNAETVLRAGLGIADLSDLAMDVPRQKLILLSDASKKIVTINLDGTNPVVTQLETGNNTQITNPEGIAYLPGREIIIVGEPRTFARYACPGTSGRLEPYISEFMAKNVSGLRDESGKIRDWLEIHNPTPQAINLAGWKLTDTPGTLSSWVFPDRTLPPGGYLTVFCSGKNRTPLAPAPLHTDFKLSAEAGGQIQLLRPDNSIASNITYATQSADVSFGFSASNSQDSGFCATPTPGGANTEFFSGALAIDPLAPPTFSLPGGVQSSVITNLTLTTSVTGATIYYTTDGSEPYPGNANSAVQSIASGANFPSISTTTVLRASVGMVNRKPSDSVTRTFIFPSAIVNQSDPSVPRPTNGINFTRGPDSVPRNIDFAMDPLLANTTQSTWRNAVIASLQSLPTVSLVGDDQDIFHIVDGIYPNSTAKGDAWERRVSFEYSKPASPGHPACYVQANAGAHMTGHTARYQDITVKHNFNLAFKSIYGPSHLELPFSESEFFEGGAAQFDELEIRNPTGDAFSTLYAPWQPNGATYLNDAWFNSAMRTLGHPALHRRFVHCYLNGKYWGVYELMEHVDDHFCEAYPSLFNPTPEAGDKFDILSDTDHSNVESSSTNVQVSVISGNSNSWQVVKSAAVALYNPSTGVVNDQAFETLAATVDLTNLFDYILLNWWGNNGDWPSHNFLMVSSRSAAGVARPFKFMSWDAEMSLQKTDAAIVNQTWTNDMGPKLTDGPGFLYRKLRYYLAAHPNSNVKAIWLNRLNALAPVSPESGFLAPASVTASFGSLAAQFGPFVDAETARWGDAASPGSPRRRVDWENNLNFLNTRFFPERFPEFRRQVLQDLVNAEIQMQTDSLRAGINGQGYPSDPDSGTIPSDQLVEEAHLLDTDGDGLPDAWEIAHGFNPDNSLDGAGDEDGDGITNLQEYIFGTDPNNNWLSEMPAMAWALRVYTPLIQ